MKENDVLKAIRGRRSVIRFTDAPVSDEQVDTILEAGRWAPSYINSQPWEFIVVRDKGLRTRVAEVLKRATLSWQGFAQAPVLIAVAVDPSRDPRHSVEDGAAAVQNMTLAAHSLGLGSSWAGLYAADGGRGSIVDELRGLLNLPKHMSLVAVVPIGAAGYEATSTRRPLAEIVHAESFRP
jgi:nitroreductase